MVLPFELSHLGQYVRGQRDKQVRGDLVDDVTHATLVNRIHKAEQQAHGNGLYPTTPQTLQRSVHLLLIQRRDNLTAGINALGHTQPFPALNNGMGRGQTNIKQALFIPAAQLNNVPKSLGCNQADVCAGKLQHGVCHNGRAEDDRVSLGQERLKGDAEVGRNLLQPSKDAGRFIGGNRRRLPAIHLLVGIDRNKIGKSPANVDPNTIAHECVSNNS